MYILEWCSVYFFFVVDIPFLTFYDLDLIRFGETISLATGIFHLRCNQVLLPSVNSQVYNVMI